MLQINNNTHNVKKKIIEMVNLPQEKCVVIHQHKFTSFRTCR